MELSSKDEIVEALYLLDAEDFEYVVKKVDQIKSDWGSTLELYVYFRQEMQSLIDTVQNED